MGIPRGSARLLLDEHRQRPFQGTVGQLGRSTVYVTQSELAGWAAAQGVSLSRVERIALSHDPRLAEQGCIDDRTFFGQLGFDRVESLDIADWEGADHIADLNRPVAAALHGRFDAIFETGTIIQIFDLAQVFRNLDVMLKPGGRAIHAAVPSSNHVDLGFTMFSPTLLHDVYSANGYRIDASFVCEYAPFWHRGRLHAPPWRIYRYDPAVMAKLSYGGWGARQLAIFVVATKLETARTEHVVPQLGQYRETWQDYASGKVAAAGAQAASQRDAEAFDAFCAAHPWLERLYLVSKPWKQAFNRWRDRRRLEIVARY